MALQKDSYEISTPNRNVQECPSSSGNEWYQLKIFFAKLVGGIWDANTY